MSNTSRTVRTTSYSIEEDKVLCGVYLDIVQDKEKGTNQTAQPFWTRVEDEYHRMLPKHIHNRRPCRSLQTRMQNMLVAVSKLNGCVRQVENMNPSGASEQDILYRARELLAQDTKFQKGFKFDHVWPMLKDMEKFKAGGRLQSVRSRKRTTPIEVSQSPPPARAVKSIGSSSFCVDLNDDFESEDQSIEKNNAGEHRTGRKKEKLEKQVNEEHTQFVSSMKEENQEIKGMFLQTQDLLQKSYELQLLKAQTAAKKAQTAANKVQLEERREENKILCIDLESVKDPMVRESIKNEQRRIVAKRANEYGGGV